ncbi:MAG: Bacterial non-heme ferritin [Phycisphaerae bacterium]|nr:Bacterial non-heme ferritin [Phycisphaerae bacterium]
MLTAKMAKALNEQINAELYSSYLYLAMSAYFQGENLTGFAKWMRVQADEERMHAMKFYDYVLARGGTVKLTAIEAPPASWKNALDVFKAVYEHELKVSALINDLSSLSQHEKDHASHATLEWFVTEQVEEEATADNIVKQLKLAGSAPGALFILDRELGARAPSAGAAGAT